MGAVTDAVLQAVLVRPVYLLDDVSKVVASHIQPRVEYRHPDTGTSETLCRGVFGIGAGIGGRSDTAVSIDSLAHTPTAARACFDYSAVTVIDIYLTHFSPAFAVVSCLSRLAHKSACMVRYCCQHIGSLAHTQGVL